MIIKQFFGDFLLRLACFGFIWTALSSSPMFAQVGAFDFYVISSSGNDKISVSQREWVKLSLAYHEKKMNNWYEKFWANEKLKSPDDCYVRVVEAPMHANALLIVFELGEKVAQLDSSFEIHSRITSMLIDDLTPKLRADSTHWVEWMAAVTTVYDGKAERKADKLIANSANLKYIYPKDGDLTLMAEANGTGAKSRRIDSRAYAYHFMQPIVDDLHLVYKQYLDVSGLKLGLNAEISMEEHRINSDMITFVFKMDSLATQADISLNAHRDIAKQLLPFVKRKAKPIQNKWLRFRFEAEPYGKYANRVMLLE